MPFYGSIVVIKRSGADGSTFPLINEECLLGRAEGCDIRIQLPIVSKEHAKLKVQVTDGAVNIIALSKTNNTKLNGVAIPNGSPVLMYQEDQFTIGDRHFRWEYPNGSTFSQAKRTPEAETSAKSSPVKSGDSSLAPITKRIAELEAAEGTPSRGKRVSFGNFISPELFDKTLPPDTPVRKGAVPISELKKGASADSPRPSALARSLAIKRSTSNPAKRVSTVPSTPGITEEGSPKGVLKRQDNDLPKTKSNSGYRSSPRASMGGSDSESTSARDEENIDPLEEDMDVDVAKTSTQPTTSPRKVEVPESSSTPSRTAKRKTSISPPAPKSSTKRQKKEVAKTPETSKSKSVPKTPMVNTPARGATPKITTPRDAILDSPSKDVKTPKENKRRSVKTPMVRTPAKGETPKITTPKDAIFESPNKDVKAKTPKTPATISKLKTPRANAGVNPKYGAKTPKSLVKKVGKTPKQSYSEIVKKNLGKSVKKVKIARVAEGKIAKVKKTTKVVVKSPKVTQVKSKSTTGHVNSPENIVIGNKVKKATPKNIKKTPKSVKVAQKTPKSVVSTKTPRNGKTPKGSIVQKLGGRTPAKRTLWSEIVKKNLGKTPNKDKKTLAAAPAKTIAKKTAKKAVMVSKVLEKVKNSSTSSTGHANSPAPIVITKRTVKRNEVKIVTKKGQKTEVKKTGKIVEDNTSYEGVEDMLKTPGKKVATPAKKSPAKTPVIEVSSPKSATKKSSEKRFPQNLSVLQTHERLGSTPGSGSKRRQSLAVKSSPKSTPVGTKSRKSVGGTPSATPQNKLLSRLKETVPKSDKGPKRHSFRGSPSKDFLSQSLTLSQSPGDLNSTNFDFDAVATPTLPVEMLVSPLQKVAQKSPKNDLSDVAGVKSLMRTPRVAKAPKNDLTDVKGVKKLMATPKAAPKSPKNSLDDVKGVKNLVKTPRGEKQKEPNNDLTDVVGVKKLMKTPKEKKGPKNELTDVKGVKKLMATPKSQKAPKNDLSDVGGVKKLMASPKTQNSPRNDLTDLAGVKKMLKTPKNQKGPKNELSNVAGVKNLLSTPRTPYNSPVANYSDVRGVKNLLKTPGQAQKSPRNVLDDLTGVADLVSSPALASTSSSKGRTRKRKGGEEEPATESIAKKAKASDEATTSSKAGSEVPKFSLDDVEETEAELAAKEISAKPTRGRRGAAKKVEEAEEAVASPAPRGRRAKAPAKAEETPVEKKKPAAKRGKKAAEAEEKPESEEEVSEATPVKPRRGRKPAAASTPAPVEEEAVVKPVTKRGGRSKKAAEVEPVKETVDKAVTADETIEEEPPKSARGRKTAKKTDTQQEEDSSVKKTSTRGRKAKSSAEETPKAEETPAASTGRRGRAKAAVKENLEETITKPPPKSRLASLSEEEQPAQEVATPAKKGRGRKKAEPVAVEEEATEEAAPAKPAARKGRAKKAVEEPEDKPEPKKRGRAAAVVEEAKEVDTPSKRRGRPKKVVEEETAKLEAEPKPMAKRGRKAAAAKTEDPEKETIAEEEEVKPKRGRKAAASKTEAIAASPVKETKAKRGRKAAVEASEETEEAPATVSPVKPRGRAAAKKAATKTKSDLEDMSNLGSKKRRPASKTPVKRKLEEVEEAEEPTQKKTRSRRK